MGNSESHPSTDTRASHDSTTPAGAAAAAGSKSPEGGSKDVGQGKTGVGSSRKSSTEASAKGMCAAERLGSGMQVPDVCLPYLSSTSY